MIIFGPLIVAAAIAANGDAFSTTKMDVTDANGQKTTIVSASSARPLDITTVVPTQAVTDKCGEVGERAYWGNKNDKTKFGHPPLKEYEAWKACLVSEGYTIKAGK